MADLLTTVPSLSSDLYQVYESMASRAAMLHLLKPAVTFCLPFPSNFDKKYLEISLGILDATALEATFLKPWNIIQFSKISCKYHLLMDFLESVSHLWKVHNVYFSVIKKPRYRNNFVLLYLREL